MSARHPRRGSREERIALVYAQMEKRDKAKKSHADYKREKGSCGLPPADYRQMRSGSIATRSRPRTKGKIGG